MLVWLAILALAAFGLVKWISRRSGTRVPDRGAQSTLDIAPGALAVRDVAWSALAGVVGSLLSIGAGVFTAAVTMNPDDGATFVAIWFWLAGPPVSAVAMAAVVRLRHWDPPAVGVHAAVAFAACLLCGLVALAAASARVSTPPRVDPPPTTGLGSPTIPTSIQGEGEARDAVVYAFEDVFFIEHYDDMKVVGVQTGAGLGRGEFLAAVLRASTEVQGVLRPAFRSSALPVVGVDGPNVVLDWDSDAASNELSLWSTSAGSTGLNLVLGMVFDNDPAVDVVEMRIDGSCQLFTETMQGAGCQTFPRERWSQFRNG